MNVARKLGLLVLVVACAAALLPACGPTEVDAPDETAEPARAEARGQELFEQHCGLCHQLERARTYDGDETWEGLVARMIDQHGARIDADEAEQIVAHLDDAHPLE